ncbi:MAG: SDR family oxidoreductase [Myxococcales bacterium]|nr:SDR family oxidoreductase [Myxococcales bacterium]
MKSSQRDPISRAVAVVGVGAVLPDAPDAPAFWQNVLQARDCISEVPPDRWSVADYYDPDPKAPEKTYSKIGGWVRGFSFDPVRLRIPPRVAAAMDDGQKWVVAASLEALKDSGYPDRPLDLDSTAVILGNAMGGERHYLTSLRVFAPEYIHALEATSAFRGLPEGARTALVRELKGEIARRIPEVTEDSMPGELANIMAGRVAAVLNLRGPNYTTDAACASSLAALDAAVQGLLDHHFDAVLTGGMDRNMGAPTFVKFCKIGALSPDGSRPYAKGANGFVMGEGGAVLLLKRVEDAEAAGDRIYAVIRSVGASSDGKGKGITAPNPVGQVLAIRRAWNRAGLPPNTATLIEGHGTSTRVGDVVEVESLASVIGQGLPAGSIALGSVKSQLGHLKSGAGAASLLKVALALHHKVLPPSINFHEPNPDVDFARTPFFVSTRARRWEHSSRHPRRAGLSAFGFGGTNFHVVLEEHVKGLLTTRRPAVQVPGGAEAPSTATGPAAVAESRPDPARGLLMLGAENIEALRAELTRALSEARSGRVPPRKAPRAEALRARERLVISFDDALDLVKKGEKALAAFDKGDARAWRLLQPKGVHHGHGAPPKVAFLFPGQGSQYVNMLAELRRTEPVVAETFAEADEVMGPILGRPLTSFLFVEAKDAAALEAAEAALRDTTVCQPAVLTCDVALTRLLARHGITADLVLGHSLGEWAAVLAAGMTSFGDALVAVSARAKGMASVAPPDPGKMASVLGPYEAIAGQLAKIEGYVVAANLNSRNQTVIAGDSDAVMRAVEQFNRAGLTSQPIPVSHAFHSKIVAPASDALYRLLCEMTLRAPGLPVVANLDGELYPADLEGMRQRLARQLASPVQFVKGLETLYREGARLFVEVGPKRVLQGFAENVLGDREGVLCLSTNHPKRGDLAAFHDALCGIHSAGLPELLEAARLRPEESPYVVTSAPAAAEPRHPVAFEAQAAPPPGGPDYLALGKLFARFLEEGMALYRGAPPRAEQPAAAASAAQSERRGSVVISGAGLGLPGKGRVFDDRNFDRILSGESFIEPVPEEQRERMLGKNVVRLVKREVGEPSLDPIRHTSEVIRLAARKGAFDLTGEFGVPSERASAYDVATSLAIAAGLEALRDAGIPLVRNYRRTTTGGLLPDRWLLPRSLADETGVIFASAFPGVDNLVRDIERYHSHQLRCTMLEELEALRRQSPQGPFDARLGRRIDELQKELSEDGYVFDRRFLFQILSMGHAQFAELLGARGPNTQVNAACASTTQATALAEDWIRSGRCRRVVVIGADDVTSDALLGWIGAGFLASGAATTEDVVERAALPFDRRRHGMLLGMGACALVIEAQDALVERGMRGLAEILATECANSAYHGTRLDVEHIAGLMERLVRTAEQRYGLSRQAMAKETVFVSHETYTPARGGSAAAEVHALRRTFGAAADSVVVANTKGFTGHPMGVGIEDAVAVKILEKGIVPPVPNFQEPDPELGALNLSRGGRYPVRYALRLAAGFGSQIAMTLAQRVPGLEERVASRPAYERWLAEVSGRRSPALVVEHRTLRIKDTGAPDHEPIGSRWAFGTPPGEQVSSLPLAAPASVPAPIEASRPSQQRAEAPPAAAPVDPVAEKVLALVGAKTGYPRDMLALDLDLEADLGVDTVKQAEVFGMIREAFGIPRQDDLKLREYPTLKHVIGFVQAHRPDLAQPAPTSPRGERDLTRAPVASTDVDPVAEKVLALVGEKTGYPRDMLDLDLDLEADLGIDTVKQAEVFGMIREAFGIPRQDDLKLREYPTLKHVIGFVRTHRPDLARPAPGAPSPAMPIAAPATAPAATRAASSGLFRFPMPVLRPGAELCKRTSVRLERGDRVVVFADRGGAGSHLAAALRGREVEVLLVEDRPDPCHLEAQILEWSKPGKVTGAYFLSALDPEPAIPQLQLAEWRTLHRERVKSLYALARALYQPLAAKGGFLLAATRMGGVHGYEAAGAQHPSGGAVTGFIKALARERTEALLKAVDFEESAKAESISLAMLTETERDPGAVEIGHRDGQRYSIAVVADEPGRCAEPVELGRSSVFVVTGGAGAITSAITRDLAAASGGTFHLIDVRPNPDEASRREVAKLADRDTLKREIFESLKAGGTRATPALVEKRILDLERSAAILDAIRAVEDAGGKAHYHSADITDAAAMNGVVERIFATSGRIDVIVHAAGLERSRSLDTKPVEEFDLVFDVKADGLFNLLRATAGRDARALVCFSSVAGRFGNAGQTDYSAGNDLMCKTARRWAATHQGRLAFVPDWTAWGGVGMATRGNIPELMRRAGIEMLAPEDGIPVVRRMLTGGFSGEAVVGRSLGVLLSPLDPDGGLDLPAFSRACLAARGAFTGGMGATSLDLNKGLRLEVTLDPKREPFLRDHEIDGTPVLPGVMGLEGFAEVGTLLAPQHRIAAIEDVRFHAPLKYFRREARAATFWALPLRGDDGQLRVRVALVSTQTFPDGRTEEKLHFTATLTLQPDRVTAPPPPSRPAPERNGRGIGRDDIYRVYFHGPAYQVLSDVRQTAQGNLAGAIWSGLPADMAEPARSCVFAPRLIELCFQTAGVWEIGATGQLGLPAAVEQVKVWATPMAPAPLWAEVSLRSREASGQGLCFDARVCDESGRVYVEVQGYRTAQLPGGLPEDRLRPFREVTRS